MTEALRKSWWKRKRWIAALAIWLAVAYPPSVGPVAYIEARAGVPSVA